VRVRVALAQVVGQAVFGDQAFDLGQYVRWIGA
jgi:hypothetical protein